MIQFIAVWDGLSEAQLYRFSAADHYAQACLEDIAETFGEEGVRLIRPEVRAGGDWRPSTGATERGISYRVVRSVQGVTVEFHGSNMTTTGRSGPHNIADMIDVGNFPAYDVRYAKNYGLKAFPIAGRAGDVNEFFTKIHGMGGGSRPRSGEYPKNFSEKVRDSLDQRSGNLAEKAMDTFLDRLVIG